MISFRSEYIVRMHDSSASKGVVYPCLGQFLHQPAGRATAPPIFSARVDEKSMPLSFGWTKGFGGTFPRHSSLPD